MVAIKSLSAVLAFAGPALVAAHAGCESYVHGQDLFKRDEQEMEYTRKLKARFPEVNARVEHGLAKRQQSAPATGPVRPTGTITNIQSSAIGLLSSGTGTAEPTLPLPTTYASGTKSPINGAPNLPHVVINPANYPTLDRPPPTDSPEVQRWLSQIDLSDVPNYAPTQPGFCANASNAQAVASASQTCWWTCGGCTRATDITYCPAVNTWGVSYDDGPAPSTPKLLDYMVDAGIKSTFFLVGSRVISRPDMVQYEYMAGHQLAVHTWSHWPLTTQTNEEIVAELGWSKKAIYDVTGVTPAYMRPPYGDIDDRVRAISLKMGLTPVIWTAHNGQTFDTRDWQIAGGVVNATGVAATFAGILSGAPSMTTGFIVLAHDLYQQSVNLAVDYVLPLALSSGRLTLEPIINCLGSSMSEAYIETKTNASSAALTTLIGASGVGFPSGISTQVSAIGGGSTGAIKNSSIALPASTGGSNAIKATSAAYQVAVNAGLPLAAMALAFALLA